MRTINENKRKRKVSQIPGPCQRAEKAVVVKGDDDTNSS